jgi:glycerol-3-phosphate dehydrogenase
LKTGTIFQFNIVEKSWIIFKKSFKLKNLCETAFEYLNIQVFLLHVLNIFLYFVGTTDSPCDVTDNPTPSETEISFILNEIKNYLSPDVNGM